MILVEHSPPVITLGIGADERNILASPAELMAAGIEVHRTRRGGDVTYHGPGQLVGYLILRLGKAGRGVREHVHRLEELVIRLLADLGVSGERRERARGVWVGQAKIAAVGVAVSKCVSYHGFALNVSPSMEHFSLIVPCGLRECPVTSLEQVLGKSVDMSIIKERAAHLAVDVLGFSSMQRLDAGELGLY